MSVLTSETASPVSAPWVDAGSPHRYLAPMTKALALTTITTGFARGPTAAL